MLIDNDGASYDVVENRVMVHFYQLKMWLGTTVRCTYKRPIPVQKWMFTHYYILYFVTFLPNAQLPALTTKDHASSARHSCRGCLEREERLFIMGVKNKGAALRVCSRSNGQLALTRSSLLHHRVLTYNTQHKPALLCGKGDHYRNKT